MVKISPSGGCQKICQIFKNDSPWFCIKKEQPLTVFTMVHWSFIFCLWLNIFDFLVGFHQVTVTGLVVQSKQQIKPWLCIVSKSILLNCRFYFLDIYQLLCDLQKMFSNHISISWVLIEKELTSAKKRFTWTEFYNQN